MRNRRINRLCGGDKRVNRGREYLLNISEFLRSDQVICIKLNQMLVSYLKRKHRSSLWKMYFIHFILKVRYHKRDQIQIINKLIIIQ